MEKFWNVRLGPELAFDLPIAHVNGYFYIYAFDMMGRAYATKFPTPEANSAA
jgi:hypothetical protein